MISTILAIGDQHFTTKNVKEIEMFIDVVSKIALEVKPDIIVLLGDLLHTHEKIHTVPLNYAYTFIKKMRDIAKTYVLVGNHDYINASQFLTDNHWLNSLKEWDNLVVVDAVKTCMIDDHNLLVFSPYVEPERFVEALDTIENWKEASIIFGHQEFFGCNMNGNYVSNQGKWDLNYPQVISGHIHTKQHLQKNIYYTGSSMETEWKDVDSEKDGYNTIAVVRLADDKTMEIEEKEIRLNRKLKVHLKIEDLENFVVPEENKDDQIRVQISGILYEEFNTLKETSKYKELLAKDVKIDFEFNKKEIKVNNEKLQTLINEDVSDFRTLMESVKESRKDPYYHEIYELVMNDRVVKAEDILILK